MEPCTTLVTPLRRPPKRADRGCGEGWSIGEQKYETATALETLYDGIQCLTRDERVAATEQKAIERFEAVRGPRRRSNESRSR
jgi:hypothetical protein